VEGVRIRRNITLNVVDDPEARIAERLKDFSQRLSDLELKDLDENSLIQVIKRQLEDIQVTSMGRVLGDIQQAAGDMLDLGEEYLARGQTAIRLVEGTGWFTDQIMSRAKPVKADAVVLRETVAFNDGFFDQAKFDAGRFGYFA
jgi:hypothetical protein